MHNKLSNLYKQLQTDPTRGLTSQQAQQKLQEVGYNELVIEKTPSLVYIFIQQFADPLIYLLIAAAGVIFFVGQSLDAFIIGGILIFNAIIGTIQEKRTENILQGLQAFFNLQSIVIRDGQSHIVPSNTLVPGDVIRLTAGEKIPADAYIISSTNFHVDESMLTGESHAVFKTTPQTIYSGTHVISGHATAFISVTGQRTELGKIHTSIETINTNTPLKKELEALAYWILIFVFVVCAVLFTVGLLTHKPIIDLLVMLTALFICIVPEGLPVVMTLVLMSGAYKMAQRNVLVKHLKAIEALGRVNVIIIDKTGTLTRNEMVVSSVFVNNTVLAVSGTGYFTQGEVEQQDQHINSLDAIATACVLLNNTTIDFNPVTHNFTVKGDQTQAAAYIFAQKVIKNIERTVGSVNQIKNNEIAYDFLSKISGSKGGGDRDTRKKSGLGPLTSINPEVFVENVGHDRIGSHSLEDITQVYTIPFDAAYRYTATFFVQDQLHKSYIFGAPEVVFAACNNIDNQVHVQLEKYLAQGYRVLAIAQKTYADFSDIVEGSESTFAAHQNLVAENMIFLGLLAIQDEPRANLAASIKKVHDANIQIIMATGDHPETAIYVAKKVGIISNEKNMITGQEFAQLDDQQAIRLLQQNFVCARFSPQDKLRLVRLFHQQGKIVATTGDGVNDVPALVASDISIAMGSSGTQITKQASDIILLQDSFENIVYAIQQGYDIFFALRRTVLYFLTSNMGEVLIVFFALIMSLPLPLLPAQILWLNLITDGFLDVALAMEPTHDRALRAIHHQNNIKIFDLKIMYTMFYLALPMSIAGLITFMSLYTTDIALARTLTLVTLAMFQWFNACNCRSETKSILQIGFFSNFWLSIATITVFVLQILVVYAPCMQKIFKTVPLTLYHWIYAIGVASSVLIIEEIRKLIVRRFFTL